MSLLEVSLIMVPIYGVKSQKNLYYGGVNRHFQAKLAYCRWMAVCFCRWIAFCWLWVKCFLQVAMLGLGADYLCSRAVNAAHMSVNTGHVQSFTDHEHG